MTFTRLAELRDDLTAALNIDSQNRFLLDELMRAKDTNARLLTALSDADVKLREFRARLDDQDLEIRRLKVAVEAGKSRPKPKRTRYRPRTTNRKQKAL
jgi:hypothetical protein